MILRPPPYLLCLLCMSLFACTAPGGHTPGPLAAPPVIAPERDACLARVTTPAIFETVTDQVMVQPPALDSDGTLREPAVYRTVTRQRIVRERRAVEFETPCPGVMTPAFIASVQ